MATSLIKIGETEIDTSTVTPPSRIWRKAWVWNDPNIELDHALMKPIAHAIVQENYNAAHNVLVADYTTEEIATWPKQEAEARAHQLDSGAATPFLDGYVANNQSLTGADNAAKKVTLCNKIESNADAFQDAFAEILGQSKELKFVIEASKDAATLDAMDLSIKTVQDFTVFDGIHSMAEQVEFVPCWIL